MNDEVVEAVFVLSRLKTPKPPRNLPGGFSYMGHRFARLDWLSRSSGRWHTELLRR